jgi:hypothetical protein
VYYGKGRQLEYDFIVAPGGDPARIDLRFTGAERLTINAAGELVLHTAVGELRQPEPVIYQEIDGERRAVSGGYVLTGADRVGFRVGSYDRRRPLVIDPVLAFSTYFGGSSDDSGWDIAVDANGNVYITGARPSVRSLEAYDYDAFVAKFSAAGALLWMTDLGDTCDDEGRGIALDRFGSVYITGHLGYCYPFPELKGGAFVAKLSSSGALSYLFPFSDEWTGSDVGQAVAVDSAGNAYVTGLTSSGYFPSTPGAFQQEFAGGIADGFVVKVNAAGNTLLYSTFLGGDDHESPNDIAVDSAGRAYVTGSTYSTNFPTRSAFLPQRPTWGSYGVTGFVSKLTADGSGLVYSTYLGGGPSDVAIGIALDASGNAYVTGVTESSEFPTTPGVVQPQPGDNRLCFYRLCTDAFVTKLNASGTALVYSTYLGGDMFDEGVGIAVDTAGNAYVTGSTSSFTFPTVQAFQPRLGGESDAFVAKLNATGSTLVYSSYLGGGKTSEEYFDGYDGGIRIAVDGAGTNAYVIGQTYSANFPVAAAHQPTIGGGRCGILDYRCADAFVTKIADRCPPGAGGVLCKPSGGGGGGLPPAPAPVSSPLTTTLNQATFMAGQTLVLTATLTPAVATPVDAYILFDVPGAGTYSLQLGGAIVPGVVPIASGFVPFAYSAPVLQYTFRGGEPAGAYRFRAYLTHAGTSQVIGAEHTTPMDISR